MSAPSFLDRPAARLVALGVLLLVAASLAFMHRDDLFPPPPAATIADDPVARCLAERAAGIEQMLADGVIDEAQAGQFKGRAAALCAPRAARAGEFIGRLAGSSPRSSGGKSDSCRTGPSPMTNAYSMAFCSSRTLPGKS